MRSINKHGKKRRRKKYMKMAISRYLWFLVVPTPFTTYTKLKLTYTS